MPRPTNASRLAAYLTAAALIGCAPDAEQRDDLVFGPPPPAAPMAVRVSANYANVYFTVPAQRLELSAPRPRKRPVVIVVTGCGFADAGADYPRDALRLSVDESPTQLDRPTMMEACQSADTTAIRGAVTDQVSFLITHIGAIALADPSRVILFASGEAAPVAAEIQGPFLGKVLLGDPCLVAWRPAHVDRTSPTFLVRASGSNGFGWTDYQPSFTKLSKLENRRAISASVAPRVKPCEVALRPPLPSNFSPRTANGPIGLTHRSKEVREVEAAAFEALLNPSDSPIG